VIAHWLERQPESIDRSKSLSIWLAAPGVCLVAVCCHIAGDALTSPFHPCHLRGGILSVALSVVSLHPGITWQVASILLRLSSPKGDYPIYSHQK